MFRRPTEFSSESDKIRSEKSFIHFCTARGRLCQSTCQTLVVHRETDNAPCLTSGTTTVYPQVFYKKTRGGKYRAKPLPKDRKISLPASGADNLFFHCLVIGGERFVRPELAVNVIE